MLMVILKFTVFEASFLLSVSLWELPACAVLLLFEILATKSGFLFSFKMPLKVMLRMKSYLVLSTRQGSTGNEECKFWHCEVLEVLFSSSCK